jgi:hypothetical protein
MKSMKSFIGISFYSIALACLAGCASSGNPVKKFHVTPGGYKAGLPEIEGNLEPWSGMTQIVNTTNSIKYMRQGYHPVVQSSFLIAESYSPAGDILSFGKEIRADLAIWNATRYDTVSGTSPVYNWVPETSSTTTTTGTYNSNLTGNSYNSNFGNTSFNAFGNGNYSGQSTTTTPGYIATVGSQNYSVNRNNVFVTFYRKLSLDSKIMKFGFKSDDLTTEELQKIGKNHGRKIKLVINGGLFFDANLMDGDIILEVNGKKVHSGNLGELLVGTDLPEYIIKFQRGDEVFEKTFNF